MLCSLGRAADNNGWQEVNMILSPNFLMADPPRIHDWSSHRQRLTFWFTDFLPTSIFGGHAQII